MLSIDFISLKEANKLLTKLINQPFQFLTQEKLIFSDKLSLLNRFDIKFLALKDKDKVLSFCPIYVPKDKKSFVRLGFFYQLSELRGDQISEYIKLLKTELSKFNNQIVGPLKGHMNLGFSLPVENSTSSFLTTDYDEFNTLIYKELSKSPFRKYYAYNTHLNNELVTKLFSELKDMPSHLSIRPLSFLRFKKEMKVYNKLVNQCLQEHPYFEPLSSKEEWEVMKGSMPILNKNYFLFLYDKEIPIGFCFGVPDYNTIIDTGGDIKKFLLIQKHKNKVNKGRIIYSGILPKYRGKKLFKYVRHQVLLNMYKQGIRTIESSYIDENNKNSLGNVSSTKGSFAKEFFLYNI